jgi:hypothetical protein
MDQAAFSPRGQGPPPGCDLMSHSDSVEDRNRSVKSADLFVEFDARQIEISTDIAEVRDMVIATYFHMLVSSVTTSAGRLEVRQIDGGYELRGEETTRYEPADLQFLPEIVKDEIRIQFMRARPDLLWLHAAAVERDGSALLISGASGQGKSTLSTLLCERGWRLMSDDIAPMSMDADVVLPFFQKPQRRIYPGHTVSRYRLSDLERVQFPLEPRMLRRQPAPISAIVYLRFSDGAQTGIERLSPGTSALELLRNAVNFFDHKDAAVARAAEIARRFPGFSLTYSEGKEAAGLLDGYPF